jgi:hypothetical protein
VDFHGLWQAQDKLKDAMIQSGDARFNRYRHTHAIQFGQDVISQVGHKYPVLGYDRLDGSIDTLGLQHP